MLSMVPQLCVSLRGGWPLEMHRERERHQKGRRERQEETWTWERWVGEIKEERRRQRKVTGLEKPDTEKANWG